ncbi:histidine kinase [Helicobacter monodelphidis]|uniref:PAS domain-containing protein n=1 Tax=Helicobacter sp. 15-1451 TaxID=2004995 RepID=UPI000DCDD016|nr:PAS domain-containing protein [Helicobacter sp. 15-1451]RAX57893.1 histidine kinase [Helicobacter sp. 15-1451]
MIETRGDELLVADGTLITSKTDLHGNIIYCNEDFLAYSGYSEEELFMRPHNIIRHPDMPRAAFKLLWDTIQQGKEFFAFVKNLTRDKKFYWVFTNVTPSYDAKREIISYYSVRRKPARSAINTIVPLYQAMLEAEKKGGIQAGVETLSETLKKIGKPYNQVIYELQEEIL